MDHAFAFDLSGAPRRSPSTPSHVGSGVASVPDPHRPNHRRDRGVAGSVTSAVGPGPNMGPSADGRLPPAGWRARAPSRLWRIAGLVSHELLPCGAGAEQPAAPERCRPAGSGLGLRPGVGSASIWRQLPDRSKPQSGLTVIHPVHAVDPTSGQHLRRGGRASMADRRPGSRQGCQPTTGH